MDAIEKKARELCDTRGFDPDGFIRAAIRKNDRGRPVSGFIKNWEFFKHEAENQLRDVP